MASRCAFGRHSDEIRSHVAGKRLALHFCRRRIMPRRRLTYEERRFSQNATGNVFRQLVAIRDGLREPRFGWVGEKTALDEHTRNRGLAQNVITAPPNATIFRWRAGDHVLVNVGRKRSAIGSIIISLDSIGSRASAGIEMNADENRVAIRIRDGNARRQRNKHIGIARHHHFVAGRLQFEFETDRDIERHIFSGTRWPGIPPRSKPPCPASITTIAAWVACTL